MSPWDQLIQSPVGYGLLGHQMKFLADLNIRYFSLMPKYSDKPFARRLVVSSQ